MLEFKKHFLLIGNTYQRISKNKQFHEKNFFSEIASPPQGPVMHPIVATSAEFHHTLGKQKKREKKFEKIANL